MQPQQADRGVDELLAVGFLWRSLPARIHHTLIPAGFLTTACLYLALAATLRGGTPGGPWLPLLLVLYGTGMTLGFSPLVTQALMHVPRAEAADASGLFTTALRLSQMLGVATSANAVATVQVLLAVLVAAGLAAAVTLARTVRAAAPAGGSE